MTGEHLPVSKPQESSPLSRVSTRVKDWIHTHTPEGRREEYLGQWQHVLEGVSGLPRFELEKRLNDEAGKYARGRVLRNVFVVAATATGAVVGAVGIIELKKRNWQMGRLFSDLGAKTTNWAKETVRNAASAATKLGLEGAARAITDQPDLITDLASRATEQAATGVQQAAESTGVQTALATSAFDATSAALQGATAAAESHAKAAPHNFVAMLLKKVSSALSPKKQ